MGGITLVIEVDDKGTPKVKQFSDETKKAFEEMKKGPGKAAGSLNSLKDSWAGVIASTGIAVTAFYVAKRAVFDMAPALASAGNEIERMARNLNMSTDEFQRWSYVVNMADISIQEFGGAFAFLTRSMNEALQASGDASKAFNALGISLKDSTDKTKDQQTVLMETIGALEKYGDGVNRDALMLAIFGRAFMSIKPLIDQGTKAIQENKDEAERLSLILGKDVIRSLSESEDSFKKWSMTLKVARMEVFEPIVRTFTQLIEGILKVKQIWESSGISGIIQTLRDMQAEYYEEQAMPAAPDWVKEWVAGWKPVVFTKPEAPGLPGGKGAGEADAIKEVMAAIEAVTAAEELRGQVALARAELAESGWIKEKDIVEQVREELEHLDRETNEWGEMTVHQLELIEGNWKKIAAAEEIVLKAAGVRTDQAVQEIEKLTQSQEAWISLFENISSAWDFNVTGILRGTEKIGDAFKNMVDGMVDSFISGISKMIMQWALSGLSNWFGTIFTTTPATPVGYAQYGIGYVPQTGPYILHQGEAVIPADKNKGSGDMIVNVINNAPNTKTKTRESQDGRGNRSIEVIISEFMAKEIGRTGSAPNTAVREMGGKNKLVRR